MAFINQQNNANVQHIIQNQPENPNYSPVSFWLFTNRENLKNLEFNLAYKTSENELMTFKSTNISQTNLGTIKLYHSDIFVDRHLRVIFENQENSQHLEGKIIYSIEDYQPFTTLNPEIHVQNISTNKPTMVFDFKQPHSGPIELENFVCQVIKFFGDKNQFNHLKVFLNSFKIHINKSSKSNEPSKFEKGTGLTGLLDLIKNSELDFAFYYYFALDFYDLEDENLMSLVRSRLKELEKKILQICLKFKFFMDFLDNDNKQSIGSLTGELIIQSKLHFHDGDLLKSIAEIYEKLSVNDTTKKSLDYLKEYTYKHLKQQLILERHKKQKMSKINELPIIEIKFLLNKDDDSNETLVSLTDSIKALFELMKICHKDNFCNKFYKAIGKRLIFFFGSERFKKVPDEQIIEFFKLLNNFDDDSFGKIIDSLYANNLIVEMICEFCIKNELFYEISDNLMKFKSVFKSEFLSKIIIPSKNDSTIPFIKLFELFFKKEIKNENPEDQIKKLGETNLLNSSSNAEKTSKFKNDDRNNKLWMLETDLGKIYKKRPLDILVNFEKIHFFCTQYPEIEFFNKMFDIIEMNLDNFEKNLLENFRKNVKNELIISQAIEHMIIRRIHFEKNTRYRLKIINKIKEIASENQKRTTVNGITQFTNNDPFIDYILNNINNHMIIEKQEKVIELVFEDVNKSEIEELIEIIKSTNDMPSVQSFKERLKKEFSNLKNGNLTVEKYLTLKMNYKENSGLETLYKTLNPNSQLLLQNLDEIYNNFKSKFDLIKSIIDNFCKNCLDYQKILKDIEDFFKKNNDKTLNSLWNLCQGYLKDFEWKKLGIFSKNLSCYEQFDLQTGNDNELTVEEKLKNILQKILIFESKVEIIQREFRKMTLDEVKTKLNVKIESDLKKFIESFFKNKNEKQTFMMCVDMINKYSALMEYLEVFESVGTQLNFQMRNPQQKKVSIEKIRLLKPKTSVFREIEGVAKILKDEFDDYYDTEPLAKKFKFLIGFKELFELLKDKKNDFERFKEVVTDFQDFELTWNNINDLEIILSFFEKLNTTENNQLDNQVIFRNLKTFEKKFDELTKIDSFKEIAEKIEEFRKNYSQFNIFFQQPFNVSESLRKWIIALMTKSNFDIDLSEKAMKLNIEIVSRASSDRKECSYEELEKKRNVILMKGSNESDKRNQVISNSQIKDLKVQSSSNLSNEKTFLHQEAYVEFFRQLEILNDLILEMKNYGYKFSNSRHNFSIINGSSHELIELIRGFKEEDTQFKAQVLTAYSNQFLFTLLHHDMVHQLAQALKDRNEDVRKSHILDYLGFSDHKKVKAIFNNKINDINPKTICHEIELLMEKELNQESAFYQTSDFSSKKALLNSQYYVVKIPKRQQKTVLYKTILGVSIVANDRLPDFHNILFCNSTITLARLNAFIQRVFNCPSNQVFMIVLPELLDHRNQQEMIRLIREISRNKQRKSYLFLLYFSDVSPSIIYFFEHKNKNSFSLNDKVYQEDINSKIKHIQKNVTVVTSNQSLIGKTQWILDESKSEHENSKLIYLRLTGIIEYEFLFNNLMDQIDNTSIVIHLDIGPIHKNSIGVLDELLFSLIFLKTFETKNRVIVIPENTKFFIELDVSMISIKGSIEFFQFEFDKKEDINSRFDGLIPVSEVPLLFFQSYQNKSLRNWNMTYLEKELIYPQDQTEVKIAEANVGLDDKQPKLKIKNVIPSDIKQKFSNYLKDNRESSESDGILPHQLIFQKLLHFFAYNYSQSGVLLDLEDSQNQIAEFIFKSTKYLTHSSFQSLKQQQTEHRKIFTDRNIVEDNSEELNKIKTEFQEWNNNNTVFMTFNQGFPIIVYKKKELIPEFIWNRQASNGNKAIRFLDIGDDENNEIHKKSKQEIHNMFFNELAHLNDKLNSCKFCKECCNVYYQDICKDCKYESISAEDYWNSNRNSKYVLQIIKDIPLSEGKQEVKENHKIDAFVSFLKNLFGNQIATAMSPDNQKQMVCLTCQKKTEIIKKCKECCIELITGNDYFEENKDKEVFQNIHRLNQKSINLKRIKSDSNLKTYCVFSSDINCQFISFISKSLLQKKYVLTLDNYSKLLQIHVRAKSRLPIVLMGETGCGKTSLIRFLCGYLLDDHFEIYSMHAGISESHLFDKVTAFFRHCELYPKKDCWIMFDEFNTSDTIGLVKTLMIDRRLNNKTAPVNAIFVATCNPFKVKKTKIVKEHFVGLKRNRQETRAEQTLLVYNVHPLPESLFYFTFDFGQLSENDERKYAEIILKRSLVDKQDGVSDSQSNSVDRTNQFDGICNVCLQISKFLKAEFDLSSTSLRDLRRFEIIYSFFKNKYFPALKKVENRKEEDMEEMKRKTLVLSVMVCYCLRLSEKEQRKEVMLIVRRHTGISTNEFESIVNEETEKLLRHFKIEKDIIINTALKDNILSMFVCLLNKIPLIIIGKPGSSKSLSLQLVFQNLKGAKSSESLFKEFDELVMVSYQGSEYSTSESIEYIFHKAEELMKPNEKAGELLKSNNKVLKGVIPVVVFDEIGLAELSKNNPLKVLHSKLEIEDIKVGFLGISNWYLDSSKMNRVLTVARTDPNEQELRDTATEMANTISEDTPLIQTSFKFLAKIYWDLTNEIKSKQENNQGVVGLRDFYHLIKQTVKEYTTNEFSGRNNRQADRNNRLRQALISQDSVAERLFKAAIYSIKRNFSHDFKYSRQMCQRLYELMEIKKREILQSITINDLLSGNLIDPLSRPLMIITNHEEVHNRVYEILTRQSEDKKISPRKHRILIGSLFEQDQDSESYCVEVVSKVIYYMNQDIILVMHQLEAIYTTLYDLFNQNFKKQGNKDYCRIVQGTISKCLYPVHKNFKVVLFLTKQHLENADEPLVNRFEKYSLTQNDFITPTDSTKIRKIIDSFDSIFGTAKNEDRALKGKQMFGNFNEWSFLKWTEKLKSTQFNDRDYDSNLLLVEIIKIMTNISSMFFSSYLFKIKSKVELGEDYLQKFLDHKKRSLFDLIKDISKAKHPSKTIVYTFSSILENIYQNIMDQNDISELNTPPNIPREVAELNSNDTSRPSLSSDNPREAIDFSNKKDFVLSGLGLEELLLIQVKSEKSLFEILDSFFRNDKLNLLIVKVSGINETKHLFYLQNTLNTLLKHHQEVSEKHVIIIVHYKQSTITQTESFPVSSEWNEVFIDDLFKGLDKISESIILRPDLLYAVIRSEDRLKDSFDSIVDKIAFDKQIGQVDDDYLNRMTGYFKDFSKKYGKELMDLLVQKTFAALTHDKSPDSSKTIYDYIDMPSDFWNYSMTFAEIIKSIVGMKFESKLKVVINLMLKKSILHSLQLFFSKESDSHKKCILQIIDKIITTEEINNSVETDMNEPPHPLTYPFSHIEYKAIMNIKRGKLSDDKKDIHILIENYKSMSFLMKKENQLISIYESLKFHCILIDLISLHLSNSNSECPPVEHLSLVFEKLISSKTLKVFKLFILNPDLTTNLIVLLSNLLYIVKIENILNLRSFQNSVEGGKREEEGNVIKNSQSIICHPINYEQTMEYFKNLIEDLIIESSTQSVLKLNLFNIHLRYSVLKHSIQNFNESSDIKINIPESFDLLIMMDQFVDQSSIDNSMLSKIVNSHYELLKELDVHNFTSTISKLRELLPGCSHEKSIEDRLLALEVMYYEKLINTHKSNKQTMKDIFEKVFDRIDESEKFALSVNSIIDDLIKNCQLEQSVSLFLESPKNYDENAELNLGNWFDDCLTKHSKRLPYLIISSLILQVRSFLKKNKDIKLSEAVQNVLKFLPNLDVNNVTFKKSTIIYLTLIQHFTNELIDSLVETDESNLAVSGLINDFLNNDSPPAKSLQIYIYKNREKICRKTNRKLLDMLKDSQESWVNNLFKSINRETSDSGLTPGCYSFKSDDHYKQLIDYFKEIEKGKVEGVFNCLEYLRSNKDNNAFLAFYSLLINECYFKKFTNENLVKFTLEGTLKYKEKFTDLLGNVGFSFIEKLLTNFCPGSPLHAEKLNFDKLKFKENSCIIFAFASILSHKNQNNHFNHLLFKHQTEISFGRLKNCYLPGMILPFSPVISNMLDFLEQIKLNLKDKRLYSTDRENKNKKIWKCSQECDFFFMCENFSQVNVQTEKSVCHICNENEKGDVSSHEPKDHNVFYKKEDEEKYVIRKIEEYKNSYSKGYFNLNNSIDDLTGKGVNVSCSTSNVLNFISNCLILVLSELKITDDNISVLIENSNPVKILKDKISDNFKKFNSHFNKDDPVIGLNLVIAKISSELNENELIDTPYLYNKFEKSLENNVLNLLFSDHEKYYNEYRKNTRKSTIHPEKPGTIIAYTDETNRDNFEQYKLIYHLRFKSTEFDFQGVIDKFVLNQTNKIKCPTSDFVFSHFKDLKNLKVVLAYKDLYFEIRAKYNGNISRKEVEEHTLMTLKNSFGHKTLKPKVEKFVKFWNEMVENKTQFMSENKVIELISLNDQSNLSLVFPNKEKKNLNENIMIGITSLINIQNQMLKGSRLRTQGLLKYYLWDSINEHTLFDLDEEKMTSEFNRKCILTYIDYGRCGSSKLDFDKFELFLIDEISKLKMFKSDDNLFPDFDYKFETGKLSTLLRKLKNSGNQKDLTKIQFEKIENTLKQIGDKFQTCAYTQIFDFCQNILLPRVCLFIDSDPNKLVKDFIEETISENSIKESKILDCLETLEMNQLFSFWLFVEILVFKNSKGNHWNLFIELIADENDKESINVRNSSLERLLTLKDGLGSLKSDLNDIGNALIRLAMRTISEKDHLEEPIENLIKDETLYELSYKSDNLNNFSVVESVKLKHCLSLLNSLETSSREEKEPEEKQKDISFGSIN